MGYTQKKIYAPDFYVIYEADNMSIMGKQETVKSKKINLKRSITKSVESINLLTDSSKGTNHKSVSLNGAMSLWIIQNYEIKFIT